MPSSETRTLGSHSYTVEKLPGTVGSLTLLKLTKAVGPALAAVVSQGETLNVPAAIATLTQTLDEKTFEELRRTFVGCTKVVNDEGKLLPLALVFDEHFADNYMELIEWLAFCVEVNFAGFFRDFAARLAAKAKRPQGSATRQDA